MIGVLALQGAFQKHLECLSLLEQPARPVKTIEDLKSCSALILPGGETTAHLKLISEEFWEELKVFAQTKPTLGTCCGLILLSSGIEGEDIKTLGALDVIVSRNAYGPQVESFMAKVSMQMGTIRHDVSGCFIRAPQIVEVGPNAQVLATHDNRHVIVQQGLSIGCSFHPEILLDTSLHEYFLSFVSAELNYPK